MIPNGSGIQGQRTWVDDPHHTTPPRQKGSQGFASLGAFGASGELSVNTDIQITSGVKSLKRLGKR